MAKILLVEDDKFLRDLIVKKLKIQNYEVSEAINGEESLKKAKEEKPNLILLDLVLAGMDGFEILKRLKIDPDTSKIPVVIMSNLGQRDDIEKCQQLGAADFLIKAKLNLGDIAGKIESLLNNKE